MEERDTHVVFYKKHSGESDQSLSQVDKDTDVKIEEIRKAYNANKQVAIDKIMASIINVQTVPHENYRV